MNIVPTKLKIPRKNGVRNRKFLSFVGLIYLLSTTMLPFSSRTAVAILRVPRIMTPSMTA